MISEILKNVGETLFLRYKDRLDRVLYSLIRVETEDLAYKLYYEIESREVEFADMAEAHSCGPEAKMQGIIGPADLTTPHPEIAARLRTATATALSPFKVDEWFSIIRLEYRFESEYNEKTQQFLGNLLLGTKTRSQKQYQIATKIFRSICTSTQINSEILILNSKDETHKFIDVKRINHLRSKDMSNQLVLLIKGQLAY